MEAPLTRYTWGIWPWRARLRRSSILQRVYFVPADVQPLKARQRVTNFYHRYAMLALALQGEQRFVPSLLEAPEIVRASGQPASYTVDTVRRMRARLAPATRLYFLIGMDAFQHIAKWRAPVELLRSAEFIVASRPGFPLEDVIAGAAGGAAAERGRSPEAARNGIA